MGTPPGRTRDVRSSLKHHWSFALIVSSLVLAHVVVLGVTLGGLGLGGIIAWWVQGLVVLVTRAHEPLSEAVRIGGDVMVVAVISVIVILHSVKEIGEFWREVRS